MVTFECAHALSAHKVLIDALEEKGLNIRHEQRYFLVRNDLKKIHN